MIYTLSSLPRVVTKDCVTEGLDNKLDVCSGDTFVLHVFIGRLHPATSNFDVVCVVPFLLISEQPRQQHI